MKDEVKKTGFRSCERVSVCDDCSGHADMGLELVRTENIALF
jgi:hypothetical protein